MKFQMDLLELWWLVMTIVNTLRRGVRPRAVALAVVFALFSGQVHLSVFADGLGGDSNVSDSYKSCEPARAETSCETGSQCSPDPCANTVDPGQRKTPDDAPCCPNKCKHCSLPCCGGVVLGLHLPETVTGAPTPAFISLPADGCIPVVELTGIFHPPRV